MDQEKLNRLLYYLEYRKHTGYEAARPTREEEKEWAKMLKRIEEYDYYDHGFTDYEKSNIFHFIRFLEFDETRNKCISCEFEEYIAKLLIYIIPSYQVDRYYIYIGNLKK